jgi:hypothetical protein
MFALSDEGQREIATWNCPHQGFIVREVLHDLVMKTFYEVTLSRAEILKRYEGRNEPGFRVLVESDAELRVKVVEAYLRWEKANLEYWKHVDEKGIPDEKTFQTLLSQGVLERHMLDLVLEEHVKYEKARAAWRVAHPEAMPKSEVLEC